MDLHVLKEKVKHSQKYSKNVKFVRSSGRLIAVSIMKLQIGCYDFYFFKYLQKNEIIFTLLWNIKNFMLVFK